MHTSRLISRLADQAIAAESDYAKLCRISEGDVPEAAANTLGARHAAALSSLSKIEAETPTQLYDKARALETCIWNAKDAPASLTNDHGLAVSLLQDILRHAPGA